MNPVHLYSKHTLGRQQENHVLADVFAVRSVQLLQLTIAGGHVQAGRHVPEVADGLVQGDTVQHVAAAVAGERRRCDHCGGRLGTAAAGQWCHGGVWEEKMRPGSDNIINIGTVILTQVSYKMSFYHTHLLTMSVHTLSTVSIIYDNSMLLHKGARQGASAYDS